MPLQANFTENQHICNQITAFGNGTSMMIEKKDFNEHYALLRLMSQLKIPSVWVGITDVTKEGEFKYVYSEEIFNADSKFMTSFGNSKTNERVCKSMGQNHVILNQNGTYTDQRAELKSFVACQIITLGHPTPQEQRADSKSLTCKGCHFFLTKILKMFKFRALRKGVGNFCQKLTQFIIPS